MEIRSRLVARDFKVKGDGREFEVFAAMPLLEAKRILFRMAVLDGAVRGDLSQGSVKVMVIDIKKAHLNKKVAEDEHAYVQLPHEAGGGVGRLKRWLYVMRSAASAWEGEYSETLRQMGFVNSRSSSTVFWCPQTDIRLVVWGDDFTVPGRDMNLRLFAKQLSSRYSVKIRAVLGPDAEDDLEVRILNRWLRWQTDGIKYVGDEQHVKTVIGGMGLLPNSKGVSQAMYKEDDGEDDTDELAVEAARNFRTLAGVVNYMALDRPDLQFAASVLGRYMSRPTLKAQARLKKVARYLLENPTVEYGYTKGRRTAIGRETVSPNKALREGCWCWLAVRSSLGRTGRPPLLFPPVKPNSTLRGRPLSKSLGASLFLRTWVGTCSYECVWTRPQPKVLRHGRHWERHATSKFDTSGFKT